MKHPGILLLIYNWRKNFVKLGLNSFLIVMDLVNYPFIINSNNIISLNFKIY